jgi:hypothetical protein
MRHVRAAVGVGLLAAALAGCNSTRFNFIKPQENPGTKPADGNVPSVTGVVNYLNENSGRVKTLRADNLSVTCAQGIMKFNVDGPMMVEKPRGFRMSLNGPLGMGRVVDLGSNNDEFWFWLSKAKPVPYQFYCSYQDLEKGVQFMPIPFQPEWVMETLGLGAYGPAERYTMDHDEQSLRLVEKAKSPQGLPVRKVIVMRRKETRPPEPQVTHYLLIDDTTNKEICSAHIIKTRLDPGTGAILPEKLELFWRLEDVTLSMDFGKVAVNAAVPPTAFVRQPLSGVPSFNLARGPDPSPVQKVQGMSPGMK